MRVSDLPKPTKQQVYTTRDHRAAMHCHSPPPEDLEEGTDKVAATFIIGCDTSTMSVSVKENNMAASFPVFS